MGPTEDVAGKADMEDSEKTDDVEWEDSDTESAEVNADWVCFQLHFELLQMLC